MLEGSRDSSLLPPQACVLYFAGIKSGGGALLGGGVPDLAEFVTLFSLLGLLFSLIITYFLLMYCN